MIRVKSAEKSLAFYQDVMGMKLLRTVENPDNKFNLYFLGYPSDEDPPEGVSQTREGLLELTWYVLTIPLFCNLLISFLLLGTTAPKMMSHFPTTTETPAMFKVLVIGQLRPMTSRPRAIGLRREARDSRRS